MRRGTTPTHTFTIPFNTSEVSKLRVIYAQRDNIKIVKTEDDAELLDNKIVVKLTQADTLRLNCKLKTDIQIRILTHGGDSLVSDIYTRSVKQCLSNEVL